MEQRASRIDLYTRPAPVGVFGVPPAMLGVAMELEMIDVPNLEDKKAKVRQGLEGIGSKRREGGQRDAWPAWVGPGVGQPRLVGHLTPDLDPGLAQGPVGRVGANRENGPGEAELFSRQVKVPACFGVRRLFQLGRLDAAAVGREGELVRLAQKTTKSQGAHRRAAGLPDRCQLNEPHLGRQPVSVQGQVE